MIKADPRPLRKFRVYAEPKSSLYCRVFIWRTKRDMRTFLKHFETRVCAPKARVKGAYWNDTVACWRGYTRQRPNGKRWRTFPVFGDFHFPIRELRMSCITHECGHAALGWLVRRNLEIIQPVNGHASESEERFCRVLGSLTRQIVWKTQILRQGKDRL